MDAASSEMVIADHLNDKPDSTLTVVYSDKMNCTVSFKTVFSEFHWCTSPAAKASKGNSPETAYKTYLTVHSILSI